MIYIILLFKLCSGGILMGATYAISVLIPTILMFYEHNECTQFECCNDRWIPSNQTLLRQLLTDKLYGQPFATKILTNAISSHFREINPPKPLVLMLHGPTGVGKNYIANILAESMFKKGKHSRYINYISSSYHFKGDENVPEHQKQLQQIIESNSTICNRQLYIFDEARRFPKKLLDSLSVFIDPGSPMQENLRKSIFLFLYEGEEPVVEWALEMWKNKINRNDLSLKDAEMRLIPFVHGDDSLRDSLLIEKGLIDHHLPFLPLERNHVRRCIKNGILDTHENPDFLSAEKLEELIDLIEDEIIFYPESDPTFSSYGCKKVLSKIRALLTD